MMQLDLVLMHTFAAGSSCPAIKEGDEMQLAASTVEVKTEVPVWNAG